MKGKNFYLKGLSFWVFLTLFLTAFGTASNALAAGTISGTVNVTGQPVVILIYSGDNGNACDWDYVGNTTTNPADGSYTTGSLENGNYYLYTSNWGGYINEWWTSGGGATNCDSAEQIVINNDNPTANFNLASDSNPKIAGTVKDDSGTPITGTTMGVTLLSGDNPCDYWSGNIVSVAAVNQTNGAYQFTGLTPEADYYIITNNLCESDYVNEWWASGGSVWFYNCHQAEQAQPNDSASYNFNLDQGYRISGTFYNHDGSSPINDAPIRVQLIMGEGEPCEEWHSIQTFEMEAGSNGAYQFCGIPSGNYYLRTDSTNCSDYVNEWWVDTGPTYSSYICGDALPLTVSNANLTNIDFHLDNGGSISGTVSNGTGLGDIHLYAFLGDDCCMRNEIANEGTNQDGTYWMRGIPATENVYLKTHTDQYANKWWATGNGVYSCSAAEATVVSQGVETTGRNFSLDLGGTLTGRVIRENGDPLVGVEVNYENEALQEWRDAQTNESGDFTFSHLAPGLAWVEIEPEVTENDTGPVMWDRACCLELNEDKDLGEISLRDGAKISGYIKNSIGAGLPDFEYNYGAKHEIGWGETESDGSFAFYLPIGTYTLSSDEDDYSMMSKEITVTDVNTAQNIGTLTAYDSGSGELISGTVTDNSVPHTGEFEVIALLEPVNITPENWGGYSPLAFAEPEGGSYSLYVVPQGQRQGTTLTAALILCACDENDLETMTVVDTSSGISTPASGRSLNYTSSGHTITGHIKDQNGGIPGAEALLYKIDGENDVFAGYAETDCEGKYTLYNVPENETYRIAAIAPDYPDATKWSSTFGVTADVSVPDINMSKTMAMPWVYLLLLSD